jgi:hypothetical protein
MKVNHQNITFNTRAVKCQLSSKYRACCQQNYGTDDDVYLTYQQIKSKVLPRTGH